MSFVPITVCALLVVLAVAAPPQVEDPIKVAMRDARLAQDNIDKTTEEMMRKLTELEVQYHKRKLPQFEARNKVLKEVKGFWGRVIENHPSHESWFRGSDKAVLAHLTDVVINDLEEEVDSHLLHHYRVELHFEPNAYFSNAILWREIRGHAHDDGQSKVSGVTWFEGRVPADVSFFNFFEKANERATAPRLEQQYMSEIGHIFRYEFWPNPFTYHDLPQYHELMQQHHSHGEAPQEELDAPPFEEYDDHTADRERAVADHVDDVEESAPSHEL